MLYISSSLSKLLQETKFKRFLKLFDYLHGLLRSVNEQFIHLVICDNGIGVPPESLTELFTPFYRVNLARDRKTGGTGLGLAIAKQAIIAHQGNIFAKNNEINGLSVTIQLPL